MKTSIILFTGVSYTAGVFGFPPHNPHGHHWPEGSEPAGHEFQAPGPYDSRSPCPGLNTLANHGYLPHDGLEISLDAIRAATGEALNYAPDVFEMAFQAVVDFELSSTSNPATFNLRDLAVHATIEQDGSQTRNDIYFGDDLHFDPTVFDIVAETLDLHDESKGKYVTVETAAHARAARVAEAMSINPTFNATEGQMMGSVGTTGLYLISMWEDAAEAAPKAWVSPFLSEDRIPYKEGFKRQEQVKTNDRLNNLVLAVGAVPV